MANSFLASIRQFLTPAVWKQAHGAVAKKNRRARWEIQPLVMVLVLMTWSCGESQAERFEAAKAFYESPEYQAAIKLREGAAKFNMIAVEGI